MKSKISKIITTLSLVLCMSIMIFAVDANAADTSAVDKIDNCARKFLPYEAETVEKYLAGENTYPKLDGYVFAGWYTKDVYAEENLLNGAKPSGTTYALFIPEHLLSVKAQVSAHLVDSNITDADTTSSIRFVTTVDSLFYQQVGFEVSYIDDNGNVKKATSSSNKVYKQLYVAGSTAGKDNIWQVTPAQSFCGLSEYFKACTVSDVPEGNYDTEFTVRPYWVTLDGDKVYGVEATKSIDDVLRKEAWISTNGTNGLAYGGKDAPYATLDYAIAHVVDGGTIHIKDTYAVAKNEVWEKHNKNVIITGDGNTGTLDLSALEGANWCVQDGVTLKALNMKFDGSKKTRIYAEGNDFTINSDVVFIDYKNANGEVLPAVYGGSASSDVESTNIKLYAGSYWAIYGGANATQNVTGDTHVTVGGNVNPDCDYTVHDYTYLLFGGCYNGNVGGNTYVTVLEGAKFNYIFGGTGNNSSGAPTVYGTTNVTFSGKSMAIYGGGRYGTNGDTNVIMAGGIVQQIFGGCERNSMTGNTNVQILGGEVVRRVYGGCYNENRTDGKFVNGNTNVMVGPKANISFTYSGDGEEVIRAISRYGSYDNECGTFIFNENSNRISDMGWSGFGSPAYHYLVKTNGNNVEDVYGNVTSAGNWLHIEPKEGYVAKVTIGDVVKYYTEDEGYYPLPELTNKDSQTEIEVRFSEKASTETVEGDTKVTVLSIADSEYGNITSDKMYCLPGETITLAVTPDEGYNLTGLSIKKNGTEVTLDKEISSTGGNYTFSAEEGTYTVEATFSEISYGVTGGTIGGVTSGSIVATETTTGVKHTFENVLYEDGSYGISLPVGVYQLYFDCGATEGLISEVTVSDAVVTEQNLAKTYRKMTLFKAGATAENIPWTLTDNGQYTVGTDYNSANVISMGVFDTVDFASTDFVMKTNVKADGEKNIIIGLALSGTLNGETESAVLGWMNNATTVRAYSMEYGWGARQFAPSKDKIKDFELTIVKHGNTLTYYVDDVQYAQWDLSQVNYVTGNAGAETITATCDYSAMTNVKVGFGLYRADNVTFSDYSYSKNATDVAKYVSRVVTYEELPDGVGIKVDEMAIASGTKVLDGTEVSVSGDSLSAVTVNEKPVAIVDGLVKLTLKEDAAFTVATATKYEVRGTVGGVTGGTVTVTDIETEQVFKFTDALQAEGVYNISLPNGTYRLYFDCGATEGLISEVIVSDAEVTEQNLAKTYRKMTLFKAGATAENIPWTLTDNGQYTVGTDYNSANVISMGVFDTVDFASTDFVMKTNVKADGEKNIIIGLALSGTLNGETENAVLGWMNNATTIRAYSMKYSWGARQFAPSTNKIKDFELTIVKHGNTLTYYVDDVQYAQWDLSRVNYVTGSAGQEKIEATCDYSAMTNVKVGFGLYRADNVTFSDYSYSTDTADIEAAIPEQ